MGTQHLRIVQRNRRTEFCTSRIDYEIAVVIATELDDDGGPAIVGYREIAERAGCSKNSVGPHVNRLVEQGVFKVYERGRDRLYFTGSSQIWDELETKEEDVIENDCPNSVPTVSQRLSQLSYELSQLSQRLSQICAEVSQLSQRLHDDSGATVPTTVESIGTVIDPDDLYNNINNNNNYYSDATVPSSTASEPSDEEVLCRMFAAETGFTPPHPTSAFYTDDWMRPLAQIRRMSETMDEAETRIRHGIEVARGGGASGKRYVIRNPRSILTAALNYNPDKVVAKPDEPQGRFRVLEGV